MSTRNRTLSTPELAPNFSSNATTPAMAAYLEESIGVVIVKYLILGTIMLVGIIGNILVIIVSTKKKAFKSSLDLYLKNLAIADFGVLVLIIPPTIVRMEVPFRWPLGGFACRYLLPFVDIFHGASIWIIVAVAAERYRNIVGMVRVARRRYTSSKAAKVAVALAWSLSFVVFCVPEYIMMRYWESPNYAICGLDFPNPDGKDIALQFYVYLMVLFSYIIPLVGVIWTYVAISRQLSRSNNFLRSIRDLVRKGTHKKFCITPVTGRSRTLTCEGLFRGRTVSFNSDDQNHVAGDRDGRRLTQNKRAKKILTPVAITFAVTMLPLNIMRVMVIHWRELHLQEYYNILFFITMLFYAANSSLNPILYSIVSLDFRKSLRSLFRKSIDRIRSVTSATSFGKASDHSLPIKICSISINGSINNNGADSLIDRRERASSVRSETTKC